MAELAYDEAVRARLDAIEDERRLHRVILALDDYLECRCGLTGTRVTVRRHLYDLEEFWRLPPGVRVRDR